MTDTQAIPTEVKRLVVNGEQRDVAVDTVAELLGMLDLDAAPVAVAVNRVCVRRRDFAAVPVRDGDEVEILAPMAGG